MANTITVDGPFITFSSMDSDWLWSTQWPWAADTGIPLWSIGFFWDTGTDKCVVSQGSIAGPVIFSVDLDSDGAFEQNSQHTKYFGGAMVKPVIDFSQGSYGATALIMLQLAQK